MKTITRPCASAFRLPVSAFRSQVSGFKFSPPAFRIFFALLLLLGFGQAAFAQSTWNMTGTNGWNTAGNWNPSSVPDSTGTAVFSASNSNQWITLNADQAALGLIFNNTGTTIFRANSSGATARKLTLGTGGITIASTAGNVLFSDTPATYGVLTIDTGSTTQTWTNNALSFTAGPVTGSGTLNLVGANSSSVNNIGQFSLGLSGYSGALNLTNARLVNTVATNGFGTAGLLTINDGAQIFLNVASTTISRNLSIAGNGWYDTGGTQRGAIRFGNTGTISGQITLAANSRIVASAAGILSGKITGGFGLEIGRAGGSETSTISLEGSTANDYSGLTTVNAGSLLLNKTGVNAIAGNVLVTSGGTLSNTANNQIANSATVTVDSNAAVWTLNAKSETIDTLNLSGAYVANKGFVTGGESSLTVTNLNVSGGGVTLNSSGAGKLGTITANTVTNTGGTWVFGTASGTQSLVVGSGGLTIGGGSTMAVASAATATTFISLGGNVTSSANANSNIISTSGVNTGQLRLNATRTFDVADGAAASDLTISAIVANGAATGAIIKTGSGLMTLSGNNTYTGGTTLSAGTLTFGNVNALSSGTLTFTGNSTLQSGASGTVANAMVLNPSVTGTFDTVALSSTLSGIVSGSGALTKIGSGTLTLSGSNTFTGNVTLNGTTNGSIKITNSDSLGTSSSAKTINFYQGTNGAAELDMDPGAAGSITLSNKINFTISSNTTTGSGIVSRTGTNEIQGNITMQSGFASTAISSSAGSKLTLSGTLSANASGRVLHLGGASTNANTISGNMDASGGFGDYSVQKNDAGVWVLSGSNSYTGVTTIQGSAGGIVVGANNALGTTDGNTTVAPGTSLGLSGNINYSTAETIVGSGQGSTAVGAFTATLRGMVQSVSGSNTFAGAIQINAAGLTRIGTQDGAQLTLSGPITLSSGVSGVQVLFRAGGTNGDFVTLKNSGNSWDSDTQIFSNNGGTGAGLRLGVDNALPIAYSVVSTPSGGSGAMLDLASFSQELNGLSSNPNSLKIGNSVNATTSVLTLNNTTNLASGNGTVIQDGGAGGTTGKIQVVKIGAFNQTLQTANTYTGGTLIKNGSITLQSGDNRLATTGTVTLGDTGTTGKLAIGETATARNQTLAGLLTSGSGGSVVGATTLADSVLTLNIASTNSFSGTLGGDGTNENRLALIKTGAGTLSLSGSNTYSGATTISSGTLQAGSTTALSNSSAFTMADVASAVLDLNGNSNSIGSLAGSGTNGGNVSLGAGTLTTGGNNTSTAYAGNISGNGGLTKAGSGVFTLNAAQGYLGATQVNAGSLIVNNTLASSGVTVADTAILGGTGTITNSVVVNSGGTLSAATATTAGTLTLGSLTLDASSNLAYEFGGTSDLIAVNTSGGLTINGGALSLYTTGGVSPLTTDGTYSLFNYSGALGGATSNLSIANSQAGKAYSLNDTGTVIQLILGTASSSDWTNGTSNGLWTEVGNWSGGVPNSFGAVANFAIAGSSVAVDGAKTVGSIIFDNATGYTITGGGSDTITLDNGIAAGAISVTTGTHTISAPIILNGPANIAPAASTALTLGGDISGSKALSFGGAGTTILAGSNSYTTTSVTAAGKLQIGAGSSAGTLGSGAVTLASGATLEFNRTGSYSASNNITGPGATLTMTDGAITLSGTKSLSVLNLAGGSPIISGNNTITTANLSGGTGTISGNNTIASLTVTGGTSGVSGSTIGTANVSNGEVNFSGINTITTGTVSGGTATFSGTSAITTLAGDRRKFRYLWLHHRHGQHQ